MIIELLTLIAICSTPAIVVASEKEDSEEDKIEEKPKKTTYTPLSEQDLKRISYCLENYNKTFNHLPSRTLDYKSSGYDPLRKVWWERTDNWEFRN